MCIETRFLKSRFVQSHFSVVNVATVSFKPFNVEFSSEKDHSKWALSEDGKSPWICIGDINRAVSTPNSLNRACLRR